MSTHPLRTQWGRVWLPYTLAKLALPGHVYLPVNRDYKPLGMVTHDALGRRIFGTEVWVDYEPHANKSMVFARNPHCISGVFINENLYLYSYNDKSMDSYFSRLEKLLSRSVGIYEQPE